MHDRHPAKKNLLILYSYWPDPPILGFNLNFQNIQKLTKRRDDDQSDSDDKQYCVRIIITQAMVLRSDQGC